ncbi:MAG: CoA ester lyase [Pseudomonadota bacterium]
MSVRPRRSVLYMPGSNERALQKARTINADALILDLEDAVAPDAKVEAREKVCAAVREGGYGNREVVIRVNALDTPWGLDDVSAACNVKPDAILVPKVSQPGDIMSTAKVLQARGVAATTKLWAMMETPLSILNARDIAATGADPSSGLVCFVLGTNDLLKESRARMTGDRFSVVPWLALTIAAARAYGLDVLDGVYNNFKDEEGLRRECEHGRTLGMDGKTLIHPSQVAPTNEVFSPTPSEVDWARKIIAAFAEPENANKGVITVDGKMVERLHMVMARRTVAIADAVEALPSAAA